MVADSVFAAAILKAGGNLWFASGIVLAEGKRKASNLEGEESEEETYEGGKLEDPRPLKGRRIELKRTGIVSWATPIWKELKNAFDDMNTTAGGQRSNEGKKKIARFRKAAAALFDVVRQLVFVIRKHFERGVESEEPSETVGPRDVVFDANEFLTLLKDNLEDNEDLKTKIPLTVKLLGEYMNLDLPQVRALREVPAAVEEEPNVGGCGSFFDKMEESQLTRPFTFYEGIKDDVESFGDNRDLFAYWFDIVIPKFEGYVD